jgi:hypothetical protein
MIEASRPSYPSSLQIPRIEIHGGLGHDERVLIFGEIGDQLFERNRWVPDNRGRRDYLSLKDSAVAPKLPSTFRLGFYLHG